MKNFVRYFFGIGGIAFVLSMASGAVIPPSPPGLPGMPDDSDEIRLHYPFHDRHADPYSEPVHQSPMYLGDPSNIKTTVEYDPLRNQYNINENMGNLFYRNPSYMSFDEFVDREYKKSTRNYWRQRATEEDKLNKKAFTPKIQVNSVIFDRIFGGNTIDIRPQGSAELSFGISVNKNGNPAISEEQRSVTTFDFKERIQMNVIANIGEKLKLSTNYNTEATFDFENKMKLEYTGNEDDIIKKIEGGNVTLPLNGQLIQGSQSLFGIKTQLQFGAMTVTTVFSQQKGKSQTIDVQSGAQTTPFEIRADQYEEKKHYFLSQYFKDHYDEALRDLNQIRSGVNITKIEVWVTNTTSSVTENRNIVAFTDLGERNFDSSQHLITQSFFDEPADSANNLYTNIGQVNLDSLRNIANVNNIISSLSTDFTPQKNYETVELARKLNATEYSVNSLLGYISLNVAMNPNQVLAVAYEYTLNGRVFRVGELSTSSGVTGSKALFTKLIKSTKVNPRFYTWDLMMKNIYPLNGYQISQDDFRLDVLYQDDRIGSNINYITDGCTDVKGIPLIRLFNLDDLNSNNDPQPDGVFDFKPGITINIQNGKIIFPVREPFGSYLRSKFCGNTVQADQYAYDALYDSTKTAAQQQPEKNKFILKGKYQSSSGSDIPLNAVNIPQGSVKVLAGGVPLTENVQYTVDYTLGRVKIIDEGILKSNVPIKVSLESQELFNLQTKRMIGARFDYYLNKDVSLGATYMNLTERPLTQKTNVGDEPISNTVIGLDGTYKSDSRVLTKLLDRLPVYSTKEVSNVTVSGEAAALFPGHASAIGKTGTSYIDDFEGAVTPLDIKNYGQWYLASTPQGQPEPGMFPEGASGTGLAYGFNRAKVAWYYVDPIFQRDQNNTPSNINDADRSNNFVREISEREIFPNRSQPNGPQSISCLNLAYYPAERGPYNYDVSPGSFSSGLNTDGSLSNPQTRWGGLTRKIETSDFETSNIEFIEFWMMDPFAVHSPNSGTGGDLYFNLGDISEDVLRDGHKSFENGIPTPDNTYPTQFSEWAQYPGIASSVYAFDNEESSRVYQDVGLDGLQDNVGSVTEHVAFDTSYIQKIATNLGTATAAYSNAQADPSGDDYSYFQSNTYDNNNVKPLERYKKYNGLEGNSPAPPEVDGYNALATYQPDNEDINKDNNLQVYESYYQYHVQLKPDKMVVGQNYITDMVDASVSYPDGSTGTVKWFQFKIPIQSPQKVVGEIENFKSIQFIRMFLKNFSEPIICRFAKLELIRGDWRKYNFSLLTPTEFSPVPEVPGSTSFDVSAVNLEENSSRDPVPYVLPPGIDQERDPTQTQLTRLNEQSLSLKVCNLEDGDARAAYKTTQLDIRSYKTLKMFVHAESAGSNDALQNGEITLFVRMGSDFSQNYYEYEIPLTITRWGTTGEYDVWPESNNIELELNKLISAKLTRNNAMALNSNITYLTPYSVSDGDRTITIKGSPNLSSIRSIMMGIRNPKSAGGSRVCGEVWVNELRLADFDEQGGWAATARVTAKLADLGTMSLVGNRTTAGWGSIEKKVSERDKEYKTSYDFSTSIELAKFLPPKANVSIPLFFNYSEQFINPQYNPLDPDVKFTQALSDAANEQIKDSIKLSVQDYTQRKSINFTNVRKNKGSGKNQKSRVYDVENLNVSYAYNEIYQRNYNIAYSIGRNHTASLGYNFSTQPKNVMPFGKSSAFSSTWLKLIHDFNFNYAPSSVSFLATVNRGYQETQLRNNTSDAYILDPTFVKTFTMSRIYGLQYDITKSLKLDFNANANATIDEPQGRIDTKEERDSIRKNLLDFGRLTQYHHTANLTYNVPLNKIPLTDWITFNARYGADYSWNSGALAYDSAAQRYDINSYGNNIQNSRSLVYNANFNMTTLYNKVPFLKKINQESQAQKGKTPPPVKPKVPKSLTDSLAAKPDSLKKPSIFEPVFKGIAQLLMSVKTVSFTYTQNNGISVPGFRPRPDFLGMDWNYKTGPNAPGWAFVGGSQDIDRLKSDIIKYNWLTDDTTLNTQLGITNMQNFSARASVEPIKNFKIELSANRNYSLNRYEYFRTGADGQYRSFSPTESGNFSMSYLTWNTSFIKDGNGFSNANFENFNQYRGEISKLLSQQNPNSSGIDTTGYYNGYGGTQQEVLTYAFLAAYSGQAPSENIIQRFPKTPMPNWRITYDGLSKLSWAKKIFQQVSVSHGYRSNYSVNSFTQNLSYAESAIDDPSARDVINNFVPRYDIQQISISEQFSPLLGVDMTFKNTLQARLEMRRDRTLTLAYSNIQVTEVRGTDYTIGLGYKLKGLKLPFTSNKKKKAGNDLNLKADFGLRENTTIIRKLVEQTNQASAGNKTITYKFSADYNINERFNVSAYFDRTVNNPFVSSSYPTAYTNAGIRLRFTLAQ